MTDSSWSPEVEEIDRRRGMAAEMGGPEKIARQRAAGTARIDGRPVLLGADDFTVRGGSGDAAIHAKQVFAEQYAGEMRLPVVRLLDGASGGGSVKMTLEAGYSYVPVNPAWDAVVDNLSLVPVVAACLGPTVGLGAARLVMSHLAVMVTGIGQLFTAGPPVVRGGTGEVERIRRRLAEVGSPFRTAERFGVQDLIDPRDSRSLLCAWIRDAYRILPEQTGRPAFGTRP